MKKKLSEKIDLIICCQKLCSIDLDLLGGIAAVLVVDKIRNWQE